MNKLFSLILLLIIPFPESDWDLKNRIETNN
jgi:hypothetical protein